MHKYVDSYITLHMLIRTTTCCSGVLGANLSTLLLFSISIIKYAVLNITSLQGIIADKMLKLIYFDGRQLRPAVISTNSTGWQPAGEFKLLGTYDLEYNAARLLIRHRHGGTRLENQTSTHLVGLLHLLL